MSDLISRKKLIDTIAPMVGIFEDDGFYINYERVLKIIIDSPTAEPKAGYWIENETTYADNVRQTCECSVCGKISPRPLGDYCRWCGAKMIGE